MVESHEEGAIRWLSRKEKEYLTVSQFKIFASEELLGWMKRCNGKGERVEIEST